MIAMVLNKPGENAQFSPEERAIPEPNVKQSVLKIEAFGLNHAEIITRDGGSPDVVFPRVIGIEAVGTIYATTTDSGVSVGQKVITLMGGLGREFDGSYEEYALIPNENLYSVNVDLSWTELATIPESFYTAYGSLKKLHLNSGKR